MSEPIFILAGGGTGGHLYPGLAVAEELVRLRPGARIVFACSSRNIDRRILDQTPFAVVPQPVRPVPRGLGGWGGFLKCWTASRRQSRDMIAELKPAAVLGLGGFAAAPLLAAACRGNVRRGMLNPDAVPGLANRYLAKRADVIFTQFESTARCFPAGLAGKVRNVGCPVRAGLVGRSRYEALRNFDLRPDRKTLVVLGGSSGAAAVNDAIGALAADLDGLGGEWQMLHIVGPQARAAGASPAGMLVRKLEYCHRMDLAYAAADLTLCRSGASTIAELFATGTPAVLMPYPHHRDRHQQLNGEALAATGAAIVVEDAIDASRNAAALRKTMIPLMSQGDSLAKMRSAAGAVAAARSNAAEAVARWLLE